MSAMSWVTKLIAELRQLLLQPTHELSRAQRWVRNALDLGRYSGRMLHDHRAPQMAAALTYRTIFSLVPLLVVSLLVIRMFGGFDDLGVGAQEQFYGWAFGAGEELPDGTTAPANIPPEVREALEKVVKEIEGIIARVSFKSIGAVGVLILFWAALALLITAEQSFNTIYGAPAGRPWHMRIVIYWAVISLGPVLLLVSLSVAGLVSHWWSGVPVVGGAVAFLSRFTALLASWLLLFLLYRLMPNTHVRTRPALIGAFTAAVLWEIVKVALGLYVRKAVPYNALYGSMFLIPLFLFWLYVSWLIVLFGLEITYTLQTLPDFRRKQWQARLADRAAGDPLWLIPLMTRVGEAFNEGEVLSGQNLAEQLDLPLGVVVQLADRLENEGLIHQVQSAGAVVPSGYALATPAQQIPLKRLLEIAADISRSADGNRDSAGWRYLGALAAAQRDAAGDTTLASVLEDPPAEESV